MNNNHRRYYQPEGVWIGDIMPYAKDGKFYIYHQRDKRINGPITDPFGWSLATTSDFVEYKDFGDSLRRGNDDEWDQFVYAGSVFEAEGKIHAFYTGFNKVYRDQGNPSQVLLHAESTDFKHWTKSESPLNLPAQAGYSSQDWRDPSIVWDDTNQEYLLIMGARKEGDKHRMTGCLVKFTSKDLIHWDFKGDFWAPHLYTMFEMPQLFKIDDWWYLVFSEYSMHNSTHYRMSKSLNGPWIKPKDDEFDGRAYYAARTAFDGNRRVLFGWVPTKEDNKDMNNYQWGGTFVPHEVFQREDNTLGVRPISELLNSFPINQKMEDLNISGVDILREKLLLDNTGRYFCLDANLMFSASTSDFSLRVFQNDNTDESYEFKFNLDTNQLTFDKSPCYRWYQLMDKGLQRPINLQPEKKYHLQLIVDDNIMTIYIDGTAMNTRVYEKFGNQLTCTVSNGELKISDICFSKDK